jgi:multiple sugar transport system substrate-binding protein
MDPTPTRLTRRSFLTTALMATSVPGIMRTAVAAPTVKGLAQISIAINQSPWLPGFRKLVDLYQQQSGNKVQLQLFPFTGLLEKSLNAMTAGSKEFDIINLNEGWYMTFYDRGWMIPLKEIDPGFELPKEVIEYDYAGRWDPKKKYSTRDGILYGVPISGIFQLFAYRGDLYEKAGLKPPETWDDVMQAARKLHDPQKGLYGYASRGHRDGVWWDWMPFLRGYGGDVFKSPPDDWTVVINSPEAVKALELYVSLTQFSPQNVGDLNQAEQIALFTADRVLQTVMGSSTYPDMDNPEKSRVVNKVQWTVVPKPAGGRHSATMGIWVMAIPRIVDQDKKKAALEFLKWAITKDAQMEYARFGSIPVRQDVLGSELANEPRFRVLKAKAASTPYIRAFPRVAEGPKLTEVLGLRLNQAVTKSLVPKEALDKAADEIFNIMKRAGYQTGMLG